MIALGVVGYDYHNECRAYQADVQMLRAQQSKYEGVASQKRELSTLKEQLAAAGEREVSLFVTPSADHALNMLGIVSNSARECNGRLWIEELKLTSDVSATAQTNCKLTLKGQALDNLVVAKFTATLRETGVFERVVLKPSSEQNRLMHNYVVECLH